MQALLTTWQNFYNIIGSAAATLTGLLFVATTLIAGIDQQNSITNAALSAFTTPTFVHFCTVLLMTVILSAPWQAVTSVSLLIGLSGVGGVLYLIVVMVRMRHVPSYQTPLKDWLWYLDFPPVFCI
jgi:CBS domain containing-hemolysin-like protein